MKKSHLLFLLMVLFWSAKSVLPAQAQVHLGGLVDLELRKGGEDSSPYVNQTPNDKWLIYTPYVRLFARAGISDKWFVSATLQADYYYGSELSSIFFSTINASWMPVDDSDLTLTVGRFVTPYGVYSTRVLSSENPFVHLPLTHSAGLPVSKVYGFLADYASYEQPHWLSMVYQRMYSQGIRVADILGSTGWLRYTLAATLAPASSYFETGQHNIPSFTGRLTLHPAVWGRIGFSFSSGPFMEHNAANMTISDTDLTSYRQTLTGADIKLSYHYYSFLAEFNRSLWKAPYINASGVVIDENMEAHVTHLAAETKIDFPFWAGGYAALRYEMLLSGDLSGTDGYTTEETWTYDRERIEIAAGYKLHRNILLKLSYLRSIDDGPGLDDDVIALQLSMGF